MYINIIINTSFDAIHCWPDCPIPEVSFLKTPHRHVFHVKIKAKVEHNDRDIEFIYLKNKIDSWINLNWNKKDLGTLSCEQMCVLLCAEFNLNYVRIMEDNENGAEVFK